MIHGSFLFNRLFEAKKKVAPTPQKSPKLANPTLVAKRLASEVYSSMKMGDVKIPSWDPIVSTSAGGKETSVSAIDKYVKPTIYKYILAKNPGIDSDDKSKVVSYFLAHLAGLVAGKATDIKKDIKRLKTPSIIGKTDNDFARIRSELSGVKFVTPSQNRTVAAFLKSIALAANSAMDSVGVTPETIAASGSLQEFIASLKVSVSLTEFEKLKFFPLVNKSVPTKDSEKAARDQQLLYGDRALAAYLGLLFPFLQPEVVDAIFTGTGNFLPETGKRYAKPLLNKAAFAPGTSFASFDHVTDPSVKKVLSAVQEATKSDEAFQSQAREVGKIILASVNKHSILSISAQKRIAKSLYYAVLSSLSPEIVNLGEIDDTRYMAPGIESGRDIPSLLSPESELLLQAAIKQAEENPMILRGLHGRNAASQLMADIRAGIKENRDDRGVSSETLSEPEVDRILKMALSSADVNAISDKLVAWLDSESYSATDELLKFIKAKLEAQETAYAGKDPSTFSEFVTKDWAFVTIKPMVEKLSKITKDDFDQVKMLKNTLTHFYAAKDLKSPDLTNEEALENYHNTSLTNPDVVAGYSSSFDAFDAYLNNLAPLDIDRYKAVQYLLAITNLADALNSSESASDKTKGARQFIASTASSEKAIQKNITRRTTMAKKMFGAVTILIEDVNFSKLFSSTELLSAIDVLATEYSKLTTPAKLTSDLIIGSVTITPKSPREEVRTAIMTLVTSKDTTEVILRHLDKLANNKDLVTSFNKYTVSLITKIKNQVAHPTIAIGSAHSPILISSEDTAKSLTIRVRRYLYHGYLDKKPKDAPSKPPSLEEANKIVEDIKRLPRNNNVKNRAVYSDAIGKVRQVLIDYSPLKVKLEKHKTQAAMHKVMREEALDRIEIVKETGTTLAELLIELLSVVQHAPADIKFMLRGANGVPDELRAYLEEELRNILLNPTWKIAELCNTNAGTIETACIAAAHDAANQASQGILYKDSSVIHPQPFSAVLPKSAELIIQLAGSLRDYTGIVLNNNFLSFDFDFDPVSSQYGILNILDTLDVEYTKSPMLSTSVVAKLCVQRYFFSGIKDAFARLVPTVSADSFVPKGIVSEFAYLADDINEFIKQLHATPAALDKLVAELDSRIVGMYGGLTFPNLFKNAETGEYVPRPGAPLIVIPLSATDPSYETAIFRIAAVMQPDPAAIKAAGGSVKIKALTRLLLMLRQTEELDKVFSNSMDLIKNLLIIEAGKAYIALDDISKNIVNYVQEVAPENAEALEIDLSTISHLIGSMDSSLYTKSIHRGKVKNQYLFSVVNPLISEITKMFSLRLAGDPIASGERNKELEEYEIELNKKMGILNRNAPGLDRTSEVTGTYEDDTTSVPQIAASLGIAFEGMGNYDRIKKAVTEGVDDPATSPETPLPETPLNIDAISELVGEAIPLESMYKEGEDGLALNIDWARKFKQSVAKLGGKYLGQSPRSGGRPPLKLNPVEGFTKLLAPTKHSATTVVQLYRHIYNHPIFKDEYDSLADYGSALGPNLDAIRDAIVIAGAKTTLGSSAMNTVKGQNDFFLKLSEIVDLRTDSFVTIKKKGKKKGTTVEHKEDLYNPIETFIKNSEDTTEVIEDMNAYTRKFLTELAPLVEEKLTWTDLLTAFGALTDEDMFMAAGGVLVKKQRPLSRQYNKENPTGSTHDLADKFGAASFQDFMALATKVTKELKELNSTNAVIDPTSPEMIELLYVYANLMSSEVVNRFHSSPRSTLYTLAQNLMGQLNADLNKKIVAAIKTTPQTSRLLASRIKGIKYAIETLTSANERLNNRKKIETLTPEQEAEISKNGASIEDLHQELQGIMAIPGLKLDNPLDVKPSYVKEVKKKLSPSNEDNIKFAMALLVEADIANQPYSSEATTIARDIAIQCYAILWEMANQTRLPAPRNEGQPVPEVMPKLNLEAVLSTNVYPYLWLLPVLHTHTRTLMTQFATFFKVTAKFKFLTSGNKTILCKLHDFSAIANEVIPHFQPLMTKAAEDDTKK